MQKSELEKAIERLDVLVETVRRRIEPPEKGRAPTLGPTKTGMRPILQAIDKVLDEYYKERNAKIRGDHLR